MKIAVTIESWRPNNGGAERSTQQIVKQLVSRGHRVVFLLGSPTRVSPCPGVEVRSAGAGKVNTAAAVRRYHRFVVEQLSRSEFDTSLSLTTLAPAAVLQPRAGVYRNLQQAALRWQSGAISRLARRLAHWTPKPRAMLRAEAQTLSTPRVKHAVALSGFIREQILSHPRWAGGEVTVLPNAAAPPFLEADRASLRQRFRGEHGLADTDVVFLFPAHAPRRKGGVALLRAFAALRNTRPEAVLFMVCPPEPELKRWAARLGLAAPRVRWLGTRGDLAEAYAGSQVTVLPSHYDPASKVVAESLLAGVPSITTRSNGACELIEPDGGAGGPHACCGRVVDDADDIAALVQAMDELCDLTERERCAAATAAVRDLCTMERHVGELELLLADAAH